MKGFEINTGKESFSVSEDILLISLDLLGERIATFRISGSNSIKFESCTFYEEELHINETVTIKVKDMEQSIPPLTVQKNSQDDLLKKYYSLKQELKEAKLS
jgi:hypothetical protein